jgi:hypothetical protein
MKKHWISLLFVMFGLVNNALQAQIFFRKDSANLKSMIQIGLGGFYGVHHIKPITPGFTYLVNNGYDVGTSASLIANLTPSLSLGIELRNLEQTAAISISNEVFIESFYLSLLGNQKLAILNYNLSINKKEFFTIGIGIGKQKGTYYASHDNFEILSGRFGTASGAQFIDSKTFSYNNLLFSIKRNFKLINGLSLCPVFELDFKTNEMIKKNGVILPSGGQSYYSAFRLFSSRLGIQFIIF